MEKDYQQGFRTLENEIRLDNLKVEGEIPSWLHGTLLRNGPAKFEVNKQRYKHWFDGLAMLHKFSFRNGQVSYANKFLHSESYNKAMEKGKISLSEFATDPCRSIFGRFFSMFNPKYTDNANVNIARIADKFLALTETPLPIEFDPETLETIGVYKYPGRISGQTTSAHPHYDYSTKEIINYKTSMSRKSAYNIYSMMPEKETRKKIGSIQISKPSYMHSFALTKNYVILAEFPLLMNPLGFLLSGKPFIENFHWKPQRGTRFFVVDRYDGSLVKKFVGDPFFAFHHVNAFQNGEEIVIDVAAYQNAGIVQEFYLKNLFDESREIPTAKLKRCILSLKKGTCEYIDLADAPIELPRIFYKEFNTKPYKYVYGISNTPSEFSNQLIKCNVERSKTKKWSEKGAYPSEPVFVPRPEHKSEDDGIILSVALNPKKKISFLLILDALSMEEIARAEVPLSIPFGLHGNFYN